MKKQILFGLSLLLLTGCVESDMLPGGSTVTSGQMEKMNDTDPENMLASSVNAIFASMKASFPVTGESGTGTERHNDFGYPSIMMFTDANGFDVVSEDNGYNWSGNELDYSDRIYTSNESLIVWSTMYKMIFATNDVIAKVDLDSEDPKVQFYIGQILAVRAFDYWLLAQLYQFNYKDNKTKPCVPLITEKNTEEALENGCARATVEDVYKQILEDLDGAIEALTYAQTNGVKRADRRYIDLAVAYGLRARVNLTMENWSAAAEDAQSAIDNTDAVPSSFAEASRPAFADINEPNWMWGIIIEETDEVVETGICNWISHMGSFNYGYCWYSGGRQINQTLFNSINDSDVRKGWWVGADTTSKNLTEEENYYMGATNEEECFCYPAYTQVKFAPYKNELFTETNANDMPIMRVEEMYLILAEGQAMSGSAEAKTTLEDFITSCRDSLYTCPDVTGAALQDEIWRQRRIELWGEGLSWYDIMRLKKGVDRRGAGYPDDHTIFNIANDDPILLWRIPESEIQANKLISDEDNNPNAPAPEPVPDFGEGEGEGEGGEA
jgi:hypothetical protein